MAKIADFACPADLRPDKLGYVVASTTCGNRSPSLP